VIAAMSRGVAIEPERSTGIGTTTASACGWGTASSVRALTGMSSDASRTRRRSTGRCHNPWRPGRLAAIGASSRMAPGRGQRSAAPIAP